MQTNNHHQMQLNRWSTAFCVQQAMLVQVMVLSLHLMGGMRSSCVLIFVTVLHRQAIVQVWRVQALHEAHHLTPNAPVLPCLVRVLLMMLTSYVAAQGRRYQQQAMVSAFVHPMAVLPDTSSILNTSFCGVCSEDVHSLPQGGTIKLYKGLGKLIVLL